jgi:hypothetical protein
VFASAFNNTLVVSFAGWLMAYHPDEQMMWRIPIAADCHASTPLMPLSSGAYALGTQEGLFLVTQDGTRGA